MLTELCQELRNWFVLNRYEGTFTISGGTLTADFLQEGQYFRIIGSVFNDGVHCYRTIEPAEEEPAAAPAGEEQTGGESQEQTGETQATTQEEPTDVLIDETFVGSVWALAIPKAVIQLAADIAAWKTKYGGVDSQAMSPYTSESFAGYSYTKAASSSSGTAGSTPTGWKSVFASELNRWRKI